MVDEVVVVEVLGVLGAEEAVAAADEGGAPAVVEAFVAERCFVAERFVGVVFFADAFVAVDVAGVDVVPAVLADGFFFAVLFFAVLVLDDAALVFADVFFGVLFFGVVFFGVLFFAVLAVVAGVVAADRARRGVSELVVAVAGRRAGVRTGRAGRTDPSPPAEDGSRRVRKAADAPARSPCSSSGQRRTDCSRDEAALAWAPETSRPSTSRTTSRVRESTPSATVSERCTSCRAGSTGHLLRRSRHPGGHVVRSRYPAVPTSPAMESRHHCSLAPASRAAQIASSAARSASTPSPSTCSSPPWTAATAEPR